MKLSTPLPAVEVGPLGDWLYEAGYLHSERLRILQSVAATRSLEQSVILGYLDEADYTVSELILEETQPEVPYDDRAWDDADTWELGPAIPLDATIVPPEVEQDECVVDWKRWQSYFPAIAGGETDR